MLQAEGFDEHLLIVGRPKEEVVSTSSMRPRPPNDPSWLPEVGSHCEFLFAEGWWTVLVKKVLGAKWQVIYEPHQKLHQATREQLRQIVSS